LSGIRVTYSGLIAFVIGLVSVFTGLAFVLIVTRRLSPEEFGTWTLLGTIIVYFLTSERIISYWTVRQVSRGQEVGKTSLLSSTIFSLGSVPLFIVFIYFMSSQSNSDLNSLLLGTILLPVFYISQTLGAINQGHRPQAISYGFLIFEITKIPAALALVFFLELGLNGAIIALFIAYVIRLITQLHFARPKIRNKFSFEKLKSWLKMSWISLYAGSVRLLSTFDIVIYSLVTGSVIGVAYYGVSLTIANLVSHSGLISQGLGPKLLAFGSPDYIRDNLNLTMYFAIPLLGIAVTFARPGLFALNPLYEDAYIAATVLSFMLFFRYISSLFQGILVTTEKVDVEENPKFLKLLKSKLFFIPSVRYISTIIYLAALVSILILFQSDLTEFELVTWWAILGLSIEVPLFIFMWIIMSKNTKISFPYANSLKYIAATIAFVIIYLITSESLIIYNQSIYVFLPGVILQLAICIGVYLAITYLIDKRTRTLFKSIMNEFIPK